MDKQQKEFITTYFRKRNMIANKNPIKREKYETAYMLNHPEMFNKDDYVFSSVSWLDDIIKNPEKIKQYKFVKNDNRFAGFMASEVLKYFPDFFELFPLNKISSSTLSNFLIDNPEYITKIPEEKLDSLDEHYALAVVESNPSYFIDYFVKPNFVREAIFNDRNSIIRILSKDISVIDKLDTTRLDSWDVMRVAQSQPEIIVHPKITEREDYQSIIEHVVYNSDALARIMQNPKLFELVKSHITISRYLISNVIKDHPELIKYFGPDKFKSETIAYIIGKNPQMVKYFNTRKINPTDYFHLLSSQPELYYIRTLSDLHMYHVKDLLKTHPQLIEPLLQAKAKPDWDEFTFLELDELKDIVEAQPSLGRYLKKYISKKRFMNEQLDK